MTLSSASATNAMGFQANVPRSQATISRPNGHAIGGGSATGGATTGPAIVIPERVPECAKDLLAKLELGLINGHLVSKLGVSPICMA